jgi:uncharacterized membrane protein
MATVPENFVPQRWLVPLLALVAAMLVPWTLVLAYRLPANHTSDHWDIAWVGFDVALAAAVATTGWAIARRATWASSVAAVAATLLLCDAWFDNVLANGVAERIEAAVEAAVVEVPLALVCIWLAHHCEETIAAVRSALDRRRR